MLDYEANVPAVVTILVEALRICFYQKRASGIKVPQNAPKKLSKNEVPVVE